MQGSNNILPVMWCVVKRLLDGRRRIVVSMEQARLPRTTECFGRNAAEFFLLAVDNPETAQGQAFNGVEDTMVRNQPRHHLPYIVVYPRYFRRC